MPSHPHDRLFKAVFSNPAQASAWLRDHAPMLAQHVDLDSLELQSGSFVDEELSERHGDLLFQARFREGGPMMLYLLFEHQSTIDRMMAFRMLRYVMRIWERELEARPGRLAPVLPVVIYHGASPWVAPLELQSLVALPEGSHASFEVFLPKLRYFLQDLSVVEEGALRGAAEGRMALLLLKHAWTGRLSEQFPRWWDTMGEMVQTSGLRALELVMRYIADIDHDAPRPEVLEGLMEHVSAAELEAIMGYQDRREAEALERGVEQGREQGLEQGRRQGAEQVLRQVVLRSLALRHGALLPEAVVARVEGAAIETVEGWLDRLLQGEPVEELFGSEEGE